MIGELFKDKRVCIVGGAGCGGVDLEQFDLVWWTNDHWREGFPIHGLFTIPTLKPMALPPLEVLHVQHPNGHVAGERFKLWMKNTKAKVKLAYCCHSHPTAICPHGAENMLYQRLHAELGTRPYTGVSAIAWLLSQPLRELYITGYSFYRRADGRLPYRTGPHHVRPHVEWFRKQRTIDPRVKFDSVLSELCPPYPKPIKLVQLETEDGFTFWEPERAA